MNSPSLYLVILLVCLSICARAEPTNSPAHLPEDLARADKVVVYRLDDGADHTNGEFWGSQIVAGPDKVSRKLQKRLAVLLATAYPMEASDGGDVMEPVVGLSFYFKNHQTDVIISFRQNRIAYFDYTHNRMDCNRASGVYPYEDFIAVFKEIYPNDRTIQSLKSRSVPLAYKFVATAVMLAEINYCAGRLRLPANLPVREEQLRQEWVFPPQMMEFSGRFDTDQYSFCFFKSGRLRFIVNPDDGNERGNRYHYLEGLTHVKSMINTNGAYRLATNWLAAIDVDLPRLEKEQPPKVRQETLITPAGEAPLPFFDVKWGDWGDPKVDVLISGNGELLELRQEVDSYSRRPASLINGMDKLLAITDAEFLTYSPLERSNLVVRFSAVHYPPLQNQSSPGTNTMAR